MTFRNYKAAHSERCDGSPYSGGMASPYSDHSAGLPSPPTVVSEYNRPYDCVNTDGPHLILTEQPQGKFRFRYKSEMVGTHGQLKAERADKNKSIFPTVKLAKWTDGPALIRLALYTGEDNVNQRRRHVHELSGKNCDRETGMCEVVVDHTTDFVATFQNLGIIHIAKRDVKDIIKQRKKAELIEHARLRRPQCTQEEIRQSITPTDMKKFDEEAEEIAKTMDLNKVVLRFQAFQYDTSVKCYRPITRAVDSELVVNLKNASTGELKIVRMSECSAPCTGGTEVWMLVEKVKKSNIRIKFFEQDTDGGEVWSAYGEFSEGDVHHQYAIIFRTPPYRTTNLRSSVRVKVQLERPNDKDISEPRDFTYYPENRKRQSPFAESTKIEEDEDYPQGGGDRPKRHCKGTSEPLDLRFIGNGRCPTDGDIIDALEVYCSRGGNLEDGCNMDYRSQELLAAQLSPQYTVPSPNHPGASPNSNSNSSHSFYLSTSETSGGVSSIDTAHYLQVPSDGGSQMQVVMGGGMTSPYLNPPTSVSSGGDSLSPQYQLCTSPMSPLYQVPSPQQVSSPQYQAPSPQQVVYQQSPSPVYQQSVPSPQYQISTSLTDHLVPHSPHQQSNVAATDSLIGAQIQQQQQLQQQQELHQQQQQLQQQQQQQQHQNLIPQIQLQPQQIVVQQQQHQPLMSHQQQQQQQMLPQQRLQQLLPPQNTSALQTPTLSMQTTPDNAMSEGEWDFSNLVQGSSSGLGDLDLVEPISLETINPDFFSSSDLQTDCVRPKGSAAKSAKKSSTGPQVDGVNALAQSLASVAISRNKSSSGGDKCLDQLQLSEQLPLKHERVLESVDVAFRVAVNAAESLQAYAATGDLGRLLATHRYLLAVQNFQGDNALHTAVSNKNWDAFNKILKAATNLRPQELLNMQNYAGETALHLAVRGGELDMTARLIGTVGSDVSLCNRAGNTPLHLAAALPSTHPLAGRIMATLLTRPINGARSALEAALQAYNYQGETALHVAVCSNNLSAVRQLVAAGAGVHLCERRRGANCLHLAAQCRGQAIADFLIEHTTITVNSRMFDGNTALHMAVQEGDIDMCITLMKAGADPTARNSLKIRRRKVTKSKSQSDESETAGKKEEAAEEEEDEEEEEEDEEEEENEEGEDDDDEPNCYTPLDYARDDIKIMKILQANYDSSASVATSSGIAEMAVSHKPATATCSSNTMDSGIDVSATDLSCSSII